MNQFAEEVIADLTKEHGNLTISNSDIAYVIRELQAEVERMGAEITSLRKIAAGESKRQLELRFAYRAEIDALRKELHRVYIAEPLSNVNEILTRSKK